jgi:hypothetical protein
MSKNQPDWHIEYEHADTVWMKCFEDEALFAMFATEHTEAAYAIWCYRYRKGEHFHQAMEAYWTHNLTTMSIEDARGVSDPRAVFREYVNKCSNVSA